MENLRRIISNEPVVIVSLIQALITALVLFGVDWTDQQVAGVLSFTTLLLAFLARLFVTPTATVDRQVDTQVQAQIAGDTGDLSDAELGMLDRQRDRFNADLDREFHKRGRKP